MKPRILILSCVFGLLTGCVSNDFKVVDALRVGMNQTEARATIQSYGFESVEHIARPSDGWPKERANAPESAWRARKVEEHGKEEVSLVEYYPVHHGLLGFGQLFLFYGKDGRLLDFYRYHIN